MSCFLIVWQGGNRTATLVKSASLKRQTNSFQSKPRLSCHMPKWPH